MYIGKYFVDVFNMHELMFSRTHAEILRGHIPSQAGTSYPDSF